MKPTKAKGRPKKYVTRNMRSRRVSQALTVLGRLGGEARAAKLTPEKKHAIAVKAGRASAAARAKKAMLYKGAGK